jgi:chorismate dehydratase
VKIATVPYCNTLPLTRFFDGDVIHALPSEQANLLQTGAVDAALLPTADALKSNYHLYPDSGLIGCDGAVMSVGFFTQPWVASLNQIQSIYWDTESHTSIALARTLLQKSYGLTQANLRSVKAEQKELADALLLIGDKALFYQGERRFWDLGKLWQESTGEGFVFACWASKRLLNAGEQEKLKKAKQTGLANLKQIFNEQPAETRAILDAYFRRAIVYDFTSSLQAGLNRFQTLLTEP